jgi:hypothetical protein
LQAFGRGEAAGPARQKIPAGLCKLGRKGLLAVSCIEIALERQRAFIACTPIKPKAALRGVPRIRGLSAVRKHRAVTVEIFRIEAVMERLAVLAAVANSARHALESPGGCRGENTLSIRSGARDDIDNAVDSIRTPERRPRTAYDFDAIDILKECVLRIPEDAGE